MSNWRVMVVGTAVVMMSACGMPVTRPKGAAAPAPALAAAPAPGFEVVAAPGEAEWAGVYTSVAEVEGSTSIVLVVERDVLGKLSCRMMVKSDGGAGSDGVVYGTCLTEGSHIYLSRALSPEVSTVERYTLVRMKGQDVLLRDEAWEMVRREGKVPEHGVLVKVAERAGLQYDMSKAEHRSVRVLEGE